MFILLIGTFLQKQALHFHLSLPSPGLEAAPCCSGKSPGPAIQVSPFTTLPVWLWSRDSLSFPYLRLFIIFKGNSEWLSELSSWRENNYNQFEIPALISRSLQGIHYFIFTVSFKHWVLYLKGTLGFGFYQQPNKQFQILKYKTNVI